MDNDRKVTALKQLQGHMWKNAYQTKLIHGHVYDDVKASMEKWIGDGHTVMIYSSGSVQAQKLLFKYSKEGDMTNLLSGYFDTKIGGKMEKESYLNIAKECNQDTSNFLFLSDRIDEIEAAANAGMKVAVSLREGNSPIPEEKLTLYPTISSFSQVASLPSYNTVKQKSSATTTKSSSPKEARGEPASKKHKDN
eukprot:m.74392 g.74392  ORF g.74392 m.74392 type:complete len:194 (-) comp11801_c0_seq1:425-1006(-)